MPDPADKIIIENESVFKEYALLLAQQCDKHLCIFSYDMDHKLYDSKEFIDAISDMVRRHTSHSVKVLTADSYRAEKLGHRLIQISRRLPSYIQIRKTAKDYASNTESFAIADNMSILFRKHYETYIGFYQEKAIPLAQQKQSYFDEVWERSNEITAFRQLSL